MIVNYLIIIVYYKPIKVTINVPSLAKVIINMVVYYYGILKLIIIN